MTTAEKVIEIAARVALMDEYGMNADTDLRDDLDFDSLDMVEMTMLLEEELADGDEIGDDTVGKWRTIGDIQEYMEKLAARPIAKAAK